MCISCREHMMFFTNSPIVVTQPACTRMQHLLRKQHIHKSHYRQNLQHQAVSQLHICWLFTFSRAHVGFSASEKQAGLLEHASRNTDVAYAGMMLTLHQPK